MRAKAVGFVAVAALTAIFATSARAHICILKNGYYDLSDPYVCDGGDGTKVLDADFYTLDSEIELDVVFQQDFILKKQLDAYQSKIRFDPGMSDPAFCNCHDQRIDKGAPPLGVDCEENKRDVCRDYPVIWNDISSVLYLSLLDNFITIEGSDYYARVAMGTLTASAPAENLLMQSLVFSNIYSSEQEAAYTFSFEPWTNLYDENFCELLTETCGASVQHRAMETRLNMLQHVQYAPQPRIISVECAPKAGCGGGEAGEAEVMIKFGLPGKCPFPNQTQDSCPTDGTHVRVIPTSTGGGSPVDVSASPFVKTVQAPSTVSFDLVGVSDSAKNSYPVSTGPIYCGCDDKPPEQRGWHPPSGSIVSSRATTITLETDEESWCRWSLEDAGYDDMSQDCDRVPMEGNWHRCETKNINPDAPDVYIACRDTFGNRDAAGGKKISYVTDYCMMRPEECDIELKLSAPFSKYEIVPCSPPVPGCLVPYGESNGYRKEIASSLGGGVVVETYELDTGNPGPYKRLSVGGSMGSFKLRKGSCSGCVDPSKKYGVRARISALTMDEDVKRILGCLEGFPPNECVVNVMPPMPLVDSGEIVLNPVEIPDFSKGAGGGDVGNPTCRPEVHFANLQPLKYRFGASAGEERYHPASDFNLDGKIDITDLQILKRYFGKAVPVSANTKLCDPMFDAR